MAALPGMERNGMPAMKRPSVGERADPAISVDAGKTDANWKFVRPRGNNCAQNGGVLQTQEKIISPPKFSAFERNLRHDSQLNH